MEQSYIRKYAYSFIVLAFPALLIGVLGPLEIYSGNTGELLFGTGDFFWLFLIISLLIVLAFAAILAFLPDKTRGFIHSIIFAISLMAYIQNMFLNKQLIKTDGSKIDWSQYRTYTIINTIIWIAAIVAIVNALLIVRDNMHKIIIYVSAFVSLVQIVAVIFIMFSAPYSVKNDKMCVLDPKDEFSLASDNNVIVLILDRYGNNTFENAWDENENFLEVYKDFTYYNNANSKYNYTFPSMTYMLTLTDPVCDVTTNTYKKNAWSDGLSKEFYRRLNEKGYTYNFYTGSGRACYLDAFYLKDSFDNITELDGVSYKIDYGNMLFLFTKTSLYKYAPYIIKPKLEIQSFYFDGIVSFENVDSCIEANGSYYEKLCADGLNVNESMENAVIITHLSGIHNPYDINENAEKVNESETSERQVQLGLNIILQKYFDELKRLDLYDKSTIIITADHGQYKDALDPQPIYLIKPAMQVQDEMTFNAAPISSEDLLPTILYLIGDDPSDFGTSIFEIYEDEERERECLYPNDGFEVYTYTHGREELRSLISDGIYTKIDATEDWD